LRPSSTIGSISALISSKVSGAPSALVAKLFLVL